MTEQSDEQVPETVVEIVTASTGAAVNRFPETAVGTDAPSVETAPVMIEQKLFVEPAFEVTLVPVDPALEALVTEPVDIPRSDRKIVQMPSLAEVMASHMERAMERVARAQAARDDRDWDAAAAELMESEGGLPDDD